MDHSLSRRSWRRIVFVAFATALGTAALAAPVQDVADAKASSEVAALEEAAQRTEHGAIVKDVVLRSASLLLGAGRPGLAPHPRVERMSLDEQVEFAGRMAAQGLLQYGDPVWICNLGCRVASNRCLSGADRREARCGGEISTRCALSAKCRERHLQDCQNEADQIRGQCMASAGNSMTCCYNRREAAFDPMGVNQCVQGSFQGTRAQTPTSSSAGGQIVH